MQLPIVIQRSAKVRMSILDDMPSLEKYDLTYGFSTLLRSIIFTPDLDERIKRNMAKRMNTVVGRIGTKTPMIPSRRERCAIIRYVVFLIIVTLDYRSLD